VNSKATGSNEEQMPYILSHNVIIDSFQSFDNRNNVETVTFDVGTRDGSYVVCIHIQIHRLLYDILLR